MRKVRVGIEELYDKSYEFARLLYINAVDAIDAEMEKLGLTTDHPHDEHAYRRLGNFVTDVMTYMYVCDGLFVQDKADHDYDSAIHERVYAYVCEVLSEYIYYAKRRDKVRLRNPSFPRYYIETTKHLHTFIDLVVEAVLYQMDCNDHYDDPEYERCVERLRSKIVSLTDQVLSIHIGTLAFMPRGKSIIITL